jgi:hypothetical protein
MQFLLDCRVNFKEHVKTNKVCGQKVSCQSDKWLWSYELKQQLFVFWAARVANFLIFLKTFLGWIFFIDS